MVETLLSRSAQFDGRLAADLALTVPRKGT